MGLFVIAFFPLKIFPTTTQYSCFSFLFLFNSQPHLSRPHIGINITRLGQRATLPSLYLQCHKPQGNNLFKFSSWNGNRSKECASIFTAVIFYTSKEGGWRRQKRKVSVLQLSPQKYILTCKTSPKFMEFLHAPIKACYNFLGSALNLFWGFFSLYMYN